MVDMLPRDAVTYTSAAKPRGKLFGGDEIGSLERTGCSHDVPGGDRDQLWDIDTAAVMLEIRPAFIAEWPRCRSLNRAKP